MLEKKCYTEEEQAKKSMQMHTLAKYIAGKLSEKVSFETYGNILCTVTHILEN